MIFWRTAWVRRIAEAVDVDERPLLWLDDAPDTLPKLEPDALYHCQATELPDFTRPLKWYDFTQYAEDLRSRNISFGALVRGGRYALFRMIVNAGVGYRAIVATYNRYQRWRGRPPFPWVTGALERTPPPTHRFKPGDLVRVKDFDSIVATLDRNGKNRGLGFDVNEMRLYCGKTYRVERLVHRIVDERSGRMLNFKMPVIVLNGVFCTGEVSQTRVFCPRAITPFWRDIWLDPVDNSRRAA